MASKVQIRTDSSIAIVGGSLTGPALALFLMKAGFENIRVYEALPQAVPLSGGVIGLDHISLGLLDTIGIEQDEIVRFPSERVATIRVKNRHNGRPSYQRWAGRNTTWNLLHDAFMRRMPPEVMHYSHRVVGLETDDKPVLQFAAADPVEADFIAFADGRRSVGRSLLDPTRNVRYAGYVAHRGQVVWESEIADFIRFEPDHAQFNVFPISIRNTVGLDWTFYLRTSLSAFRAAFGGEPTRQTYITHIDTATRFAVDELAEQLLPAPEAELVKHTSARAALPILDIARPRRMFRSLGDSTAVLVGDALAPVRPHTARGANNGIEETAGLAVALAQSGRFNADLRTALKGWQVRYLPLVEAALRRGPEIGRALGL